MSDPVASEVKTETLGLLGHLVEMRDRLLRAVILIGIAFVCLFPFAKNIYNWLAAPLVNQGQEMLIIGPVAPFLIPMKLTLMVAFLIALPYLFYQLWSFVAPGLYKHEKRLIYPLIASSIFLFYLGIAFVYYILLPMMFKIIPKFAPEVAVFSPDIAMYLDFTIMMFMAFGIGFEMPIATILLISTGMTTAEDLKKKRPYVIVGAFVAGMLLTPPDVISQIMLAIPMWLLFELGLILSKIFNVRIKEASDARKDINDKDNAVGASATAAASSAPVLSADKLWEDEDYTYEDDDSYPDDGDYENRTIHNEYQDSDSFDMDSPDKDMPEKLTDDSLAADGSDTDIDNFFDTEEFKELSDEEMDAELDQIEADEVAEDTAAKKKEDLKPTKKTVTKKPAAKKASDKPKTAPKKTTTKKTTAKKTVEKKPTTKKVSEKKPAAKKTPPKKKP